MTGVSSHQENSERVDKTAVRAQMGGIGLNKHPPKHTHTDCCQVTQARHKTVAAGCTGNSSQFPLCDQLLQHLFRHMKCSFDGQTLPRVRGRLIVSPARMHRFKDLRLKTAAELTLTTGQHSRGHSSWLFKGWRCGLQRRIICI